MPFGDWWKVVSLAGIPHFIIFKFMHFTKCNLYLCKIVFFILYSWNRVYCHANIDCNIYCTVSIIAKFSWWIWQVILCCKIDILNWSVFMVLRLPPFWMYIRARYFCYTFFSQLKVMIYTFCISWCPCIISRNSVFSKMIILSMMI